MCIHAVTPHALPPLHVLDACVQPPNITGVYTAVGDQALAGHVGQEGVSHPCRPATGGRLRRHHTLWQLCRFGFGLVAQREGLVENGHVHAGCNVRQSSRFPDPRPGRLAHLQGAWVAMVCTTRATRPYWRHAFVLPSGAKAQKWCAV